MVSKVVQGNGPTGTSVVLITPDAERTMNTHLGMCREYNLKDIDEKLLMNSTFLYFTGYMWDTDSQKEAIQNCRWLPEKYTHLGHRYSGNRSCCRRSGHAQREIEPDRASFRDTRRGCKRYSFLPGKGGHAPTIHMTWRRHRNKSERRQAQIPELCRDKHRQWMEALARNFPLPHLRPVRIHSRA